MASTSAKTLDITIEFGGGTEFLTSTKKIKKHVLKVSSMVTDVDESFGADREKSSEIAAVTAPEGKTQSNGGDHHPSAKVAEEHHATTMRDLVKIVLKELITERHSMLVEPDGSIRPGILILINDADWELEGEMEYELQDKDRICFISTLHGG